MSRRTKIVETRVSLDDLLLVDLWGRPFLHEQGNSVTRGFVESFWTDEDSWNLGVTDIEYLDKSSGHWQTDTLSDTYSGNVQHLSAMRSWSGRLPIFDAGIELTGYGSYTFIGVASENPWQDNDWPELDTDALRPGPMDP